MSKLSFEQVVDILERQTTIPNDDYSFEQIEEAFEIAIKEVGKRIPKYTIGNGRYKPNMCPTCGADLGGECNDGIYENIHYDYCKECFQKLKYTEDDKNNSIN